jgi:hypothetical protein
MKGFNFFTFFIIILLIPNHLYADLTIERKTKTVTFDSVNRKHIKGCKEIIKIKDGNVRIEDKTFGEVLIIRTDKKVVWKIDKIARTYSEISFDDIKTKRDKIIMDIEGTKSRISQTEEEKTIESIIQGLGKYTVEPKIEMAGLQRG